MSIDIIIPNYNGSNLLEKNLPRVFDALKAYRGKVIIVDDGSDQVEREKVKEIVQQYKNSKNYVELVQLDKNSGFSHAINSGVLASKADYIVLLNTDVTPRVNFLSGPIEKLERDENLFGVGCMDESIEDGKTIYRGRGLGNWERGFLHHSRGEVDRTDTFWLSGGSSILRRELFNKIGGMDTLYSPFYWEDIDLSYIAQKSGFRLFFDPSSIVVHRHSEGAIKKHYKKGEIATISYRNQIIFVWKNITSEKLLSDHFKYLPLNVYGAVKRGDGAFIKGLFLAMLLLPAIIKKRQVQKKLYKFTDETVIRNIS